MDATKTLWQAREDALTGKYDIFRCISQQPHSGLTGVKNDVQTLWHRRLV